MSSSFLKQADRLVEKVASSFPPLTEIPNYAKLLQGHVAAGRTHDDVWNDFMSRVNADDRRYADEFEHMMAYHFADDANKAGKKTGHRYSVDPQHLGLVNEEEYKWPWHERHPVLTHLGIGAGLGLGAVGLGAGMGALTSYLNR